MRSKKGFTLIELLAVILILGIIALIAIPTVNNIIENAKESASISTVDGYMKAVSLTNSMLSLRGTPMENGRYFINEDGNLIKNGKVYEVTIKGEKPDSGVVTIYNDEILDGTITVNDYVVIYGDKKKAKKSNKNKIYGLEYDITNKKYTRLNDAEGLNACVGTENESCLNDFDSEEIYKDMLEVIDSYGNIFIKIPKFYIKKEVSSTKLAWYVSKTKHDNSYYLPACFYDFANNKELDYVLVGKYDASLSEDGTKLESKSKVFPLLEEYISSFRNKALANNSGSLKGYQQLDAHVWDAIQTLFYIEFSTVDSQSIMKGYSFALYQDDKSRLILNNQTNTNVIYLDKNLIKIFFLNQTLNIRNSSDNIYIASNRRITDINYETGELTFDGESVDVTTEMYVTNSFNYNGTNDNVLSSSGSLISNTNGKYSMNYRGIENLYGNAWQYYDGILVQNTTTGEGTIYSAKDPSKYGSTDLTNDYNKITAYVKKGNSEYFNSVGYDSSYPFIQLPTSFATDSSFGLYGDYFHSNNDNSVKVILVGGDMKHQENDGLSDYYLRYSADMKVYDIGARLVKKSIN